MNDDELNRAIARVLFARALREAEKPAPQLPPDHIKEMLATAERDRRIRLPPIPGVPADFAPVQRSAAARNGKRKISETLDSEAREREDQADAADDIKE